MSSLFGVLPLSTTGCHFGYTGIDGFIRISYMPIWAVWLSKVYQWEAASPFWVSSPWLGLYWYFGGYSSFLFFVYCYTSFANVIWNPYLDLTLSVVVFFGSRMSWWVFFIEVQLIKLLEIRGMSFCVIFFAQCHIDQSKMCWFKNCIHYIMIVNGDYLHVL